MQINHDATHHIYRAAQDIEELDPDFIDIREAWHEYEPGEETGDLPRYRVHVKLDRDDDAGVGLGPTYCYPVAEHAREEWNLFLFDTVTDWHDHTITMRFGYNPDQ